MQMEPSTESKRSKWSTDFGIPQRKTKIMLTLLQGFFDCDGTSHYAELQKVGILGSRIPQLMLSPLTLHQLAPSICKKNKKNIDT